MVAASCDCPKQQRVNNQHKGVNLDSLHGLRIDLLGFIIFFSFLPARPVLKVCKIVDSLFDSYSKVRRKKRHSLFRFK